MGHVESPDRPLVSVVIVCYQHADYLEERIESVLRQTYPELEIIIVDDASTDGSQEIIERYRGDPRVSEILLNRENSGSPFAQWSRALTRTRGDLVWIAEGDDSAAPEFLATLVPDFVEEEAMVFSVAGIEYVDGDGRTLGPVSEGLAGRCRGKYAVSHSLGYRNPVRNTSAVVFRAGPARDVIHHIERFRYSGDWYFWALLASRPGAMVHFHGEILCRYRRHAGSLHGRISSFNRAKARERLQIVCEINLLAASAAWRRENLKRYLHLNHGYDSWVHGLKGNLRVFGRLCRSPGMAFLPLHVLGVCTKDLLRRVFRVLGRRGARIRPGRATRDSLEDGSDGSLRR